MQQVYSGAPENGLLHIAPVVQKEAAPQYTHHHSYNFECTPKPSTAS